MATITTGLSGYSGTLQTFFSKQLLEHKKQAVVLNQFAYKRPLDKNAGAKTITFAKFSDAAIDGTTGLVTDVQTLTEGTPISTFSNGIYSTVVATLVQYGDVVKITDILTWVQLYNALRENMAYMGEKAALHADVITRNVLVAGTTIKRYAQGAANFAALAAASTSAGKARMLDFLDAATNLRINRAMGWGGYYIATICPQVARDLQNDPDWIRTNQYGNQEAIFKGEIGKWAGCRFVDHTNPFQEDGTGSEGTYGVAAAAANRIYRTQIFGQQAYGVPGLAGEKIPGGSPSDKLVSPQMIINDKPDKSDPLNQFITAGWKGFWTAKVLDAAWTLTLSSKTEYA